MLIETLSHCLGEILFINIQNQKSLSLYQTIAFMTSLIIVHMYWMHNRMLIGNSRSGNSKVLKGLSKAYII